MAAIEYFHDGTVINQTDLDIEYFHDGVVRKDSEAAAGGLTIPIAAYHYNHHLGSMSS